MAETSLSRVRKEPSLNTNKGPLTVGRTAIYARMATTGHNSVCILPNKLRPLCERGPFYSASAAPALQSAPLEVVGRDSLQNKMPYSGAAQSRTPSVLLGRELLQGS